MTPAVITLLILVAVVVVFIWNRLSVGVVAILTSLTLLATGMVDLETALGGFGDPVVIFIASLFVLSALITPNGAAAAMLPVVIAAARRARLRPSTFLMPVAFAASADALLTLSGSVVNVLASDAALEVTGQPFGYFEFALAGLPLLGGTIIVAALGDRLLPARESESMTADFGGHVDTLVEHHHLEVGFFRLRVTGESSWSGQARDPSDGEHVRVIGVQDAAGRSAALDRVVEAGDVLVLTGDQQEITALAQRHELGVDVTPLTRQTRAALLDDEVGVAEVIVPPRSPVIGEPMFPGLRRSGVTVLGIRRLGKDRGAEPTTLAEGDALLVHGSWEAVNALESDRDVLVVDSPELLRRQAAPLGGAALRAGVVLVVMVVLLARYQFSLRSTPAPPVPVTDLVLVAPAGAVEAVEAGAARGLASAGAAMLGRDLATCPAGVLTAARIAEVATQIGAEKGLEVEVLDKEALIELGCGGKTVEVLNTDAEGRLVMADALVLAREAGADAIVDIATLTGACLRTFCVELAGIMGNHDGLLAQVSAAGALAEEPVWRLPLVKSYRKELDSDIADMTNIGGPNAGSITAGLFLEEFVDGVPWVHIDIAGTAQSPAANRWVNKGPTAFGTRLLVELALAFQAPEG